MLRTLNRKWDCYKFLEISSHQRMIVETQNMAIVNYTKMFPRLHHQQVNKGITTTTNSEATTSRKARDHAVRRKAQRSAVHRSSSSAARRGARDGISAATTTTVPAAEEEIGRDTRRRRRDGISSSQTAPPRGRRAPDRIGGVETAPVGPIIRRRRKISAGIQRREQRRSPQLLQASQIN